MKGIKSDLVTNQGARAAISLTEQLNVCGSPRLACHGRDVLCGSGCENIENILGRDKWKRWMNPWVDSLMIQYERPRLRTLHVFMNVLEHSKHCTS